jgi:hypothetical protein
MSKENIEIKVIISPDSLYCEAPDDMSIPEILFFLEEARDAVKEASKGTQTGEQ